MLLWLCTFGTSLGLVLVAAHADIDLANDKR